RGEAKFFVPVLPFLSDWFQYRDTRVDLSWDHDPTRGVTRIFAGREVVFEGEPVDIITEGDELNCQYEQSERYVICSSPLPGKKRVQIVSSER
ncbi:MAG: hypothetical protein R3208_21840, partial [Ketobacteraceae bacterium]|nr:hypothetical protein [Ketobacteraceae bacterium]